MGESLAGVAAGGPLALAIGVAALAGLVSFLSPCILPLVPGYLSYMTGLAGADLDAALNRPTARARGRIVLGATGFIAGFTAVFAITTVALIGAGRALLVHQHVVQIVVGALIVLLGLAFLGLIPGLARQWRISKLPAAGIIGAPLLGAVFALSWTPCLSPTLAAVLGLAWVEGSTGRAIWLVIAYCLGLGLPFVAFGLGFRKLLGVVETVRRNSRWVTRIGGGMLIVVGLLLATGAWDWLMNWLRASVGPGGIPI